MLARKKNWRRLARSRPNKLKSFNWAKFDDYAGNRDALPPDNAITVYDLCQKRGWLFNTANSRLRAMVHSGKMESGRFWDDKKRRWVSYFWMV